MPTMDEYDPGHRLTVRYTPITSTPPGNAPQADESVELELEIIHAFKPFTMSMVCQVRITSPSSPPSPNRLPETAILKLFDRRYDTDTREAYDNSRPYSQAKEEAYREYISKDRTPLEKGKSIFQLGEEGNEGGIEAYIEERGQAFFEAEIRAYKDMSAVQGSLIPTLYGSLSYEPPLASSASSSGHRYQAQGLLLEYIPSFSLKVFIDEAMRQEPTPYTVISRVCDQAIALMDRLDDFNVLNKDVRLENVLIVPLAEPDLPHTPSIAPPLPVIVTFSSFRCVAIDFAISRLRYPDETDEQWRRAKQHGEEVGNIGWPAQYVLRELAEEKAGEVELERLWRYQSSGRWRRELNDEEQAAYEDNPRWGLYEETNRGK